MPLDPIFFNGQWLPVQQVAINPLDRGFLFGDGCYEVIPVYRQKLFYFDAHLQRLQTSLTALGIKGVNVPWQEICQRLVTNNYQRGYVYIHISRGVEGSRNFMPLTPAHELKPTTMAYFEPLTDQGSSLPKAHRVHLQEDIRWHRCDIKSSNLLGSVLMRIKAHQRGIDDIIYYRDGYVTEATSSNIMACFGSEIATPKLSYNLLSGITRQAIKDIVAQQQRQVIERNISIAELKQADEVWLTASIGELKPITYIDDQPVGTGEISDYFHWLYPLFKQSVLTSQS